MRYFLDTEFNGMGGDLISLALVSELANGELYMATPCYSPVPWVAENVMPIVGCAGASPLFCEPGHMADFIRGFLSRDTHPIIVADWPDDIAYFCKAVITGPGQMTDINFLSFEMIRVDAYPTDLAGAIQHNALWDARALRRKLIGI